MADDKKKSPARNLLKSSQKKLIIEGVKSAYPDETNPEKTGAQSAFKGNPKKAIKQTIKNAYKQAKKSGKLTKIDNKTSPLQAALTASENKALKMLVQEPLRLSLEKQKELNKLYRKERSKLIRRISYFSAKGYEFDTEEIAPLLTGNATQEDIEKLRELKREKLRNLAKRRIISDEKDEQILAKILEENDDNVPSYFDEYPEDIFDNDIENFVDDEYRPTFEDLIYNEPEPIFTEYIKYETPQERYYRENKDMQFAGLDFQIDAGKTIINNAWDSIHSQDIYLKTIPMKNENKDIKEDAAYQLAEMLSKAEEAFGTDALAFHLQKHAEEFNKAVERALKWRDSNDVDLTRSETSYSLTEINNILFSCNPALLTENVTGNPEDI